MRAQQGEAEAIRIGLLVQQALDQKIVETQALEAKLVEAQQAIENDNQLNLAFKQQLDHSTVSSNNATEDALQAKAAQVKAEEMIPVMA